MLAPHVEKPSCWQMSLVNAITDPKELLERLELDMRLLPAAAAASKLFPLKVPREFVDRMQIGNLDDPLLRQVLPLGAELQITPGFQLDPLHEAQVNPIPGLLHKYKGRVLLTFVGTCGINCRYCFRRHFPYANNNPGTAGWDKAISYIAQDETIHEIILSGGDPLVANDKLLHSFTDKLNAIPHIKRLRIHSRMPIVMPERITPEFIAWINQLKQQPILVVHCNHPQEINLFVRNSTALLKKAGVMLLNQSVLLKGINDDVTTLVTLSEALFEIGVQPYYLHTLDKIQGAAHFDIPLNAARRLYNAMQTHLSGYLIPKLVCEQPGAPNKILINPRKFYTD